MTSFRALLLTLAIACAATTPVVAAAQDLTTEDRAAIGRVVAGLEADVRAGDFTGALDVIPPPMLAATLQRFGVDEARLRAAIETQMQAALESVRFESFAISIDDGVPARTPGVGRAYMLIPTETIIAVEGAGRVRSRNQTLALEDEGKWYLVRIEDQASVDTLRAVYPDFADVELPQGTTEAAE